MSSCLSCQGLVTMRFWPIPVLWPSYNIVSIKESKYILLAAISPWVKLGQHLQEVGYKALVEERSNCHDCPWHCILNLDESSQRFMVSDGEPVYEILIASKASFRQILIVHHVVIHLIVLKLKFQAAW